MQSTLDEDIAPSGVRDDPWSDRPVPPYVVFPALVIGVGAHGEHVVRRLREHLHHDDPHLLQVIRLGCLMENGDGVSLHVVAAESRDFDEVTVADTTLEAVLADETGPISERIRRLCDSVGIHEQLQLLAERGYNTFAEDASIHIRAYIIADLNDPAAPTALMPLADVLQASFGGRGTLFRTAICLEPEGLAPLLGTWLDASSQAFDRIYLTSRIKQHGFLVAGPTETETAHCLFLHTVLLSDAERVIADCVPGRPLTGTFGVAALRLGIAEMEEWLAGRLALRVIRDGYLAPALTEGEGPESRTAEVRLCTRWNEGLRGLSSTRISVIPENGAIDVALPHDSPLIVWCNREIDERMGGKSLEKDLPPDLSDSTIASTPLATVFDSLQERCAQMRGATEADLSVWLRDEYLVSLPGCMEHTDAVLRQWRETLRQEAEHLPPVPEDHSESETETWLDGELQRIAAYLNGIGAPHFMKVLGGLGLLGVIAGGLRWSTFHGSAAVLVSSLILLVAIVIAWRPVIRFTRQRERERAMRGLTAELEQRISIWLHDPVRGMVSDLLEWVGATEASLDRMRRALDGLAGTYAALGDQPVAQVGCFLEQVIVDTVRCRTLYSDVPLDVLFAAQDFRSLIAHSIIPPIAGHVQAEPQEAGPSTDAMERVLIDGVRRTAGPQIAALRAMSLPEVLARNDHLGPDVSRASLYSRTVERLRDRALPLHLIPSHGTGFNGREHDLYDGRFADDLQQATVPIDMLALAAGETEWNTVADEKAGGPDYLRRVHLADAQSIVYLRTVEGLPLHPEK